MENVEVKMLRLDNFQILSIKDYKIYNKKIESVGWSPPSRRDMEPVLLEIPFDWNANPLQDSNWMFQLHAWRMLDGYLNVISLEDNYKEALDQIIIIIRDWYRGNIASQPGEFTWYDMATGIRASKLAYIARVMGDLDREKMGVDVLINLVTLHFENLMDMKQLSKGNHGLFQLWGLKSLASAFPEHPYSKQAAEFAVEKMIDLTNRQMGEHGIHTENSPEYHFFAIARIRAILNAHDWQIPEMSFIRNKLDKGERAKPWLVDVFGRKVPIGDSECNKVKNTDFSALKDWPHLQNGATVGAILDGYAVVRSDSNVEIVDSSLLFLTASFRALVHKHADCLSFVWQEGGEDILVDSGKFGYSRDQFRTYFLSTRAHNTIEFNHNSSKRNAKNSYGSGIKTLKLVPNGWMIDAYAPKPANGYTHHRTVFFQPGEQVMVFDKVEPIELNRMNAYTAWWHFSPTLDVNLYEMHAKLTNSNNGRSIIVLNYSNAEITKSIYACGSEHPYYQGWMSTGYLKAEPCPTIGFHGTVKGTFIMVTVFDLVLNNVFSKSKLDHDIMNKIPMLDWNDAEIQALKNFNRTKI